VALDQAMDWVATHRADWAERLGILGDHLTNKRKERR
jgi:hypothetical protein